MQPTSFRLPGNVKPTLYTLHINPNLSTFLFNATNVITVNVLERTNVIDVHSNGLDIARVEVRTATATLGSSYSLRPADELLRIQLDEYLEPGSGYEVRIDFGGDMRGKIVGLYSSSYLSPEGQTR